jgi:hypothetical protein
MKRILIYISIILLFQSIRPNEIDTNNSCLIHNFHYSHEYLYTPMKSEDGNYLTPNLFTYPLSQVDNFTKITWIFLPVKVNNLQLINSNRKVYLIKSGGEKVNEYLCSSSDHTKISLKRRLLRLINIAEKDKFKYSICFWTLEKISKAEYYIRNMNDEVMYAASFLFNTGWYKRSVFLWSLKNILNSNKFKWKIDCSKGEFIYSK